MDNTSSNFTTKVSTHLLLAFFHDFTDTLQLWSFFGGGFFPYLLNEVYLKQKRGKIFCSISKQNIYKDFSQL